jgi:DNA-binding response OmpR family regulator
MAKHAAKKGKRVLVVEDEQALREMYATWLQSAGFDVIVADNGISGLEKVMHEEPDLLLLDILLPKKDGLEVLNEIRRNPKTAKLPVIILSSLDQDFEKKQGISLGATHYLVKTAISPELLFKTIHAILK